MRGRSCDLTAYDMRSPQHATITSLQLQYYYYCYHHHFCWFLLTSLVRQGYSSFNRISKALGFAEKGDIELNNCVDYPQLSG